MNVRRLQCPAIVVGAASAVFLVWAYAMPDADNEVAERPPPELRIELQESNSPVKRAQAAARLGAIRDLESMPVLLDALEDPSPVVRGRAGASIVAILHADFYFRANDPPEKRRKAIKKIRDHWQAWKEKGFPGADRD